MSYVFEGTFVLKLDAKGRMSLPAALRDGFAAGAVLTRHPDGCLMLYPEERWGALRERLAQLPYAARFLQRIVLGGAVRIALDAHGRIQVPASLRELSGVMREAILFGLGDRLELWDRQRYEAAEAQALAEITPEEVEGFTF